MCVCVPKSGAWRDLKPLCFLCYPQANAAAWHREIALAWTLCGLVHCCGSHVVTSVLLSLLYAQFQVHISSQSLGITQLSSISCFISSSSPWPPPSAPHFHLTYLPASCHYLVKATSRSPGIFFLLKSLRHFLLFPKIKSKFCSLPTTPTTTYGRHIKPNSSLDLICFPHPLCLNYAWPCP